MGHSALVADSAATDGFELWFSTLTEGATDARRVLIQPWLKSLCDIAEIVQEDVTEAYSEAWPTCVHHGVGAHAELHAGRAVWWCRTGEHVVSEIGMLGVEP